MKPRSMVTFIFGIVLIVVGAIIRCPIPAVVGGALCYLGWSGSRTAVIVFGHIFVALGSYLITWGLYLLPYCKPTPAHIFGRPLFWGFISLLGGICAIYHGFCKCVLANKMRWENKQR